MARRLFRALLVAGALALAFWAGMAFQQVRYDDICLDMGGGREPAGHPVCVIERAAPAE